MDDLVLKKCVPCEGGVDPLSAHEVAEYKKQISGWEVSEDHKHISKKLKFKNFVEAMKFINIVADLAESEGHHPDIHISYSAVTLELWTHAIGGLSENDFILAAKIDNIT